jgi:nucleotide-binding universal stress UspA family protein
VAAYSDQETARVEGQAHDYLKRVAEGLGQVPTSFAVRFGEPVEQIVEEAEASHATLIAMATHRRTGLARIVKGSVAERVERTTTIPVMLAQYGR